METHIHPRSGVTIEGVRMLPGVTIRASDLYDSTRGKWEYADNVAGLTIQPGCQVIWVRQPGELSENARDLLEYLNQRVWGKRTCIGEQNGGFYVIPGPQFNWDGRFDIESERVMHPECVEELVDHGFLAPYAAYVVGWMSDYATALHRHKNRVYLLTPTRAGR